MKQVLVNEKLLQQVVNAMDVDCSDLVRHFLAVELRALLERSTSVQEPQPVAFVSPNELKAMHDPEYAEGAYFRMRRTPGGKYVQPIYTAQPTRSNHEASTDQ